MANRGQLGVGLVGANPQRGWAFTTHLPAIKALPSLRVTAVSARTVDNAKAAAEVFGARQWFTDARELARSPEVDIVAVCVRVPLHFEVVMAAIEAGKHVYCEWPLGRDLAEAQRMRDAARSAGIHDAIGLQGRTNPAVERARELVMSGELGRVMSARMYSASNGWGAAVLPEYAYTADRSTGATMLSITGGHSLDSLCRIIGDFESVSALLVTQRETVKLVGSTETIRPTSPDNVLVSGRHQSGCVASVHITGGCPKFGRFRLDVIGERGEILIEADNLGDYQVSSLTLSGYVDDKPLETFSSSADDSVPAGVAANVARVYRQLASDIESGSRTVGNFDDAVAVTRLLDAIQRSSDTAQAAQRL